ncbi:DUF4296 domain-containing protein [Olleya sp. YSTF-M6]|uniref:DUF4296 domain-containing protein n=2 Tax=Olleya TaxID=336276 RepID=A0ABS1WGF5_9FLAO|nr:DUF4296 domain-containing protein [Olleya sediminilitoris]MBL7558196.1 DUF4296 domain-containing protein [Olleya sediminilitoris]
MTLMLVSCYDVQKPEKPDDLISEDKMVDVLVETVIMSSAKGINKRELENKGILPDSFIYKKHKIDSLQFVNSNNYYAYDIENFNQIYTRVKDSLEALRLHYKEVQKKEEKSKKKLPVKNKKLKANLKK